ncbi:serine O-acetyltransferase [Acuticoccus yangtzensis]|uniref:serine O-acetyltransferase n=1 Tax=Acuticoccus yangtzensis TaxID=1443441 RepID=UPI00094963A4|nr:serine O-acetyltransferase [Acuticoccus yangtzensis]ORE92209.1 serine O-acetyltransferase [Stappia sp. 22II-S9-Z10]
MSEALAAKLVEHDPVWRRICIEGEKIADREPALAGFVRATVLDQASLEDAIAERVATRIADPALGATHIRHAFRDALEDDPTLAEVFRSDLVAVLDRDAACERLIEPLLYFKGFHALAAHRVAHSMWTRGRRDFALMMQSAISACLQVDIHPQVPMGRGIFIDHATAVVIGQTATLGDDVSILQGVTLGGTGKTGGDRHPKIASGVLIGAGAKVLGNFEIGRCSRIAAGSVVLSAVPPNTTVAGVPARVVGTGNCPDPSRSMDQILAEEPR